MIGKRAILPQVRADRGSLTYHWESALASHPSRKAAQRCNFAEAATLCVSATGQLKEKQIADFFEIF